MKFTAHQQMAIDAPHDKSAIVTAAAGSGKTTLLVERIIRLLSDNTLGIHGDSFAIMTFTRNAAASLRKKLISKLSARIKDIRAQGDPDNIADMISEKLFELRGASIGTIDSFCINVLRENAQLFNLPVGFTIANRARVFTMKKAAMQKTMEMFYSNDFFSVEERSELFYTFSFEDDKSLCNAISDIAEKVCSYADRDSWLEKSAARYSSLDKLVEQDINSTIRRVGAAIKKYEGIPNEYSSIIDEYSGGKKADPEITLALQEYAKGDSEYLEKIKSAYKELCENPSAKTLGEFSLKALEKNNAVLPKNTSRNKSHASFNKLAKAFDLANTLAGELFSYDEEERILPQQLLAVSALTRLTEIYLDEYRSIMHTKGCLDFAECEYLLLAKLRENMQLREQLSTRFSCIIVDEFQDSNDIQAEIFRLISNGKNNLFYVGDVKQSIYAFRGGNPKIMERLCTKPQKLAVSPKIHPAKLNGDISHYLRENPMFSVIPLNKNFRSRKNIIDCVNEIFSGVMTKKYGGVDYEDGAQLELGSLCPELDEDIQNDYLTEINILRFKGDDSDESDAKAFYQARYVAGRIRKMLDERFKITDGEQMRPVKPADIGILLPKNKHMTIYRDALAELDIPSVIPKSGSFLKSEEIALLLDMLTVIDDPLRDEELIRVLMSPVYDMFTEQAAQLRLGVLGLPLERIEEDLSPIARHVKYRSLYGCVTYCLRDLSCEGGTEEYQKLCTSLKESGISREIDPLLTRFSNDLSELRYSMSSCSVDTLIKKVCEKTELNSIICTYEGSRQRLANIRLLIKYAEDFENSDGGTLSDFLRFMSKLDEKTLDAASAPESAASAVRIMTFHGSKGLEMPVCFLSDLDMKINTSDSSGQYLISHDAGLTLKYVDINNRYQAETFAYKSHKNIILDRIHGEELRLLYVALTRAQDKLIVTSILNKKASELKLSKDDNPEKILDGNMPVKWITRALLRQTNMKELKAIDGSDADLSTIGIGSHTVIQFIKQTDQPVCIAEESEQDTPQQTITADPELTDGILRQLSAKYPHSDETTLQAKYTVTELAHSADPNAMIVYLNMPSFVRKNAPTGKEVGDAYHHFMEHCPLERFTHSADSDLVAQVIDELCDGGLLTEREGEILLAPKRHCVENICEFFNGSLGRRVLSDINSVYREMPFYAELPAEKLGLIGNRLVCIQGRTDMYFVENGEIVLIDYKSDTAENLEKELDNYCAQIMTYKEILPQVTGLTVKELYLYSFSTGKAIDANEHKPL